MTIAHLPVGFFVPQLHEVKPKERGEGASRSLTTSKLSPLGKGRGLIFTQGVSLLPKFRAQSVAKLAPTVSLRSRSKVESLIAALLSNKVGLLPEF